MYNSLEELIQVVADGIRPPERLTVVGAAEKYRRISNPGSYVGPWKAEKTPYMVEPTNCMSDRAYRSVIFAGPSQSGKALALDTPIATPEGWTTMGELKVGDTIFSEDGTPCKVTFATEVQHKRKCYKVRFSDRSMIVADADHKWKVYGADPENQTSSVVKTTQLIWQWVLGRAYLRSVDPRTGKKRVREVVNVVECKSVPVRCIQVDHPSHMFLAGKSMVPTHNTDMFLNLLTYTGLCDPADLTLVHMSQNTARDYSIRILDRFFRVNPEMREKLMKNGRVDNTFDKRLTNGVLVTLAWPTVNELSGKPIQRVFLTDYDRMPDDVEGEGDPFGLAAARTTSFGPNGKTVAESSPGRPVLEAQATLRSKHEAPPVAGGILSLYNRGDRRRWYWHCIECKQAFEPDRSLIVMPDSEDLLEKAEAAVMTCPHCSAWYPHTTREGRPGKTDMNQENARWVKEGEVWLPNKELAGTPTRSTIASFWLKGVAATFSSWPDLFYKLLKAEEEKELTLEESALTTILNTGFGEPYVPDKVQSNRSPVEIQARAVEVEPRTVPLGVRFLTAAVDLQKNRFVVQVQGVTEINDVWIIDRFEIKYSRTEDPDRPGQYIRVSPGKYLNDWKLLVNEVLKKTYPLSDNSGREMGIRMVISDSQGSDGFTDMAYDFVRWLRRGSAEIEVQDGHSDESYGWEPALESRFYLLKGSSAPAAPTIKLTYPDSPTNNRHAGARGEIPVISINTNILKDAVAQSVDKTEPGSGRYMFPKWLPENFYKELCVEIRNEKGKWENPKKWRNESFDLMVYNKAACRLPEVNLDYIDWDAPPVWAEQWDDNSMVFSPDSDKGFAKKDKNGYNLKKLGSILG